jgi:hypothetical protein
MADKSWVERSSEAIERFMPKAGEGFNVVAVDAYEEPGDELYLVGNFESEAEAEEAAAAHTKRSGDKAYVYAPETLRR